MTFDEINKRTHAKEPIPEGLFPSEKHAYGFLEKLHGMYRADLIGKEVASELKQFEEQFYNDFAKREHDYIIGTTAYKLLKQSDTPEVKRILEELEAQM